MAYYQLELPVDKSINETNIDHLLFKHGDKIILKK
jgi:hypothetical protein